MQTAIIDGHEVFLTEGSIVDGRKIAGMFATEEDARSTSINPDLLAVGTIAWDALTPHQQEIASANRDEL